MKRVITSLLVTLGFIGAQVSMAAAAAPRYWKVDMFDPTTSTSSRTLNIEYKVLSTVEEDNSYAVRLLQNGTQTAVQTISHDYGDSGVFSVSIPATGTYTYQVVATNNNAAETKQSAEKTVKVVDGPTPTVTTVFVNNGGANGAGAGAGGQGGGAAAAAGGEQNAGQVGAGPATTTNNAGVLGAETKKAEDAAKAAAAKSRRWWYVAGGLALLSAGGAYYLLSVRRASS